MQPVPETPEILFWKFFNKSVDERWSDWAADMMMAGYDTEHLVELAGITKPYNQFELHELTTKVFRELNFSYENRASVVKDYTRFVLMEVIEGRRDILTSLRPLKKLFLEGDLDLQDFARLYWAKEDLEYDTSTYYRGDADRSNIDSICLQYFQNWLNHNNA